MSKFLSKKKPKENYELNNRSEVGGGRKDKEKDYGSITSLVNNEVKKKNFYTYVKTIRSHSFLFGISL